MKRSNNRGISPNTLLVSAIYLALLFCVIYVVKIPNSFQQEFDFQKTVQKQNAPVQEQVLEQYLKVFHSRVERNAYYQASASIALSRNKEGGFLPSNHKQLWLLSKIKQVFGEQLSTTSVIAKYWWFHSVLSTIFFISVFALLHFKVGVWAAVFSFVFFSTHLDLLNSLLPGANPFILIQALVLVSIVVIFLLVKLRPYIIYTIITMLILLFSLLTTLNLFFRESEILPNITTNFFTPHSVLFILLAAPIVPSLKKPTRLLESHFKLKMFVFIFIDILLRLFFDQALSIIWETIFLSIGFHWVVSDLISIITNKTQSNLFRPILFASFVILSFSLFIWQNPRIYRTPLISRLDIEQLERLSLASIDAPKNMQNEIQYFFPKIELIDSSDNKIVSISVYSDSLEKASSLQQKFNFEIIANNPYPDLWSNFSSVNEGVLKAKIGIKTKYSPAGSIYLEGLYWSADAVEVNAYLLGSTNSRFSFSPANLLFCNDQLCKKRVNKSIENPFPITAIIDESYGRVCLVGDTFNVNQEPLQSFLFLNRFNHNEVLMRGGIKRNWFLLKENDQEYNNMAKKADELSKIEYNRHKMLIEMIRQEMIFQL